MLHRIGFGLLAALSISVTNIFTSLHYEAGSDPVTFLLGRYVLFVGVLGGWLVVTGRLRAVAPGHRPHLWGAGPLMDLGPPATVVLAWLVLGDALARCSSRASP